MIHDINHPLHSSLGNGPRGSSMFVANGEYAYNPGKVYDIPIQDMSTNRRGPLWLPRVGDCVAFKTVCSDSTYLLCVGVVDSAGNGGVVVRSCVDINVLNGVINDVVKQITSEITPKFANPIEWNSATPYDPFTIVLYQGNSFTSRQYVPAGIDIANEEFWVETGNYNEQVEAYRRETQACMNEIDDLRDYVNNLFVDVPIAHTEDFYCKELNVYMHKATIPRSWNRTLVFRESYSPKPYDYVRLLETDSILVNGQLPSITITNGRKVRNNPAEPQQWYYLGWDEGGEFMTYPDYYHTVTGDELISHGFHYAFGVWGPIIKNGHLFDLYSDIPDDIPRLSDKNYIIGTRPQNSNVFCWDNDNIYIYITDGRSPNSFGVTYEDLQTWLFRNERIDNAVLMDGGGSNQMWTSRPALNHVQYNYYNESANLSDQNYNYQGETSRNVYSLIAFTMPEGE